MRRRRNSERRGRIVSAVAVVAGLAIVVVVVFVFLRPTPRPPIHKTVPPAVVCPPATSVVVGKFLVPAGPIAGYCQPQLVNAAQIIEAAKSYGLDAHTQEVGVMTAIGESGLRNINFGDKAGPDSRGLFQQRKNWGPLADRMDPYKAARHFFIHLLGVPGWNKLSPTQAAHAVQQNADPNYYTKFWTRAVAIVVALSADRVPRPERTPH